MSFKTRLANLVFAPMDRSESFLPLVARVLFAAILVAYFWASGLTKLGDGLGGLINLDFGAYAQIWPKVMEAASYDITTLSTFQHLVVYAGTYTEFILPLLIVLGLFTRLAALGMIGFVVVQSLTDLFGHNAWNDPAVLGAWFDRAPDGIILDQRMLWVFLLLVLVLKGGGALSLDRFLLNR